MTTFEQPTNESECDFGNIKPIEVFKYPSQASKIIWGVNSNNILQSSSQIIDFIKNVKTSIQMVISLIDIFSQIRVKEVRLYSELYQKISKEFSCIIQPNNKKLIMLLNYKGFKFEIIEIKTEEEIINLYSTKSPLYYIAWDKFDALKSKFPNLNIIQEIDYITPLDCAIFYGSVMCFNYLRNLGAKYTYNSEEYAIKGGNVNIFMHMIEEGKSFDNMINTALKYRNYEIAEYLKSNFGQTFDSIAESMYFGNYDIASYLISNGANINKVCIFNLYHYFMEFSFFSYLLLLYQVLFLFIFNIA